MKLRLWLAGAMLVAGSAQAQIPPTITVNGTSYSQCGLENGNCTWTGGGTRFVAFGDAPPDDPTQQVTLSTTAVASGGGCYIGGINWANGNNDPAPGYGKACWSAAGGPPLPTVTLTAAPASIKSGSSSTLTLSTSNATSCTGPVSGTSGTASVSPTVTTTYTENCTGPGGTASGSTTVTVSAGTPAPTVTLQANPTTISAGGSSVISWGSTNATSCSGVGTGLSGSVTVSPASTTTYTETCSGVTSPAASASVTVTVSTSCPPPVGFNTGTPTTTAGGTPNGLISGDTPDSASLRVFGNGVPFSLSVVTSATKADTVEWSITNSFNQVVGTGSFPVPSGVQTTSIPVTSTIAGYFELSATLASEGGSMPARGTQPAGYIAFGVEPGAVVPAVTYAYPDQHRFGMQGFNDQLAALNALGVRFTIDDREQSQEEPNGPNTYTPSLGDLDPFYASNPSIMRLIRLDGIPAWDSITGQFNDSYSLPTNLTEYGQYMAKVGTDTANIGTAYYSSLRHNYYQVTWEPSAGWPIAGGTAGANDTVADFVSLYQTVYTNLHSTDSKALVMGPTEPFPNNGTTASGNRITGTPGLCTYLDGVTTHGYYNAPTVPANPPELQDGMDAADAANALDNEMIALRSIMQTCKPNMILWATELGISYDVGVSYAGATQNQLYAQAAVAVRAHLITLGEGAQLTTYFFGPDFPDSLSGYGSFFDLNDSQGAFGATNLAPKPEAMAFAALSKIIDGTQTMGRYNLPTCNVANGCVHAYAFQQLGNGKVISALWVHNNSQWPTGGTYSSTYSQPYTLTVDAAGASGTVIVLDMFGNSSTMSYSGGQVALTLTESPIYVISNNASVTTGLVTAPVGYTGQ
jgi:hypothetical protein